MCGYRLTEPADCSREQHDHIMMRQLTEHESVDRGPRAHRFPAEMKRCGLTFWREMCRLEDPNALKFSRRPIFRDDIRQAEVTGGSISDTMTSTVDVEVRWGATEPVIRTARNRLKSARTEETRSQTTYSKPSVNLARTADIQRRSVLSRVAGQNLKPEK